LIISGEAKIMNPLISLMGKPVQLGASVQQGANALTAFDNVVENRQTQPMRMRQMEATATGTEQDAQMNASIMKLRNSAMAVQPMMQSIKSGDIQGAANAMRQYGAHMQSQGQDSANPMRGVEDLLSGDPTRIQRIYSELEGVTRQAQQFGAMETPAAPQGYSNPSTDAQGRRWGTSPTTGNYEQIPGTEGVSFAKPVEASYGQPVAGIDAKGNAIYQRFSKGGGAVTVDGFTPPPSADQESKNPVLEGKLREEMFKRNKVFETTDDAMARITASAADPSAAGDLALIFNYMKVLDPGSTVREGEFANAQNAGGINDRIRSTYNQIADGQRLTEGQRTDFVDRAGKLFGAAKEKNDKSITQYRQLAKRYDLNPDNVVLRVSVPEGVDPAIWATMTPEEQALWD
jgi:hypothetical protein